MLFIVAVAMVAGMGPWFAASASTAAMQRDLGVSLAQSAWLTMTVQLGFVAATLAVAVSGAADVVSAPRLMATGAVLAAVTTAAVPFTGSLPLLLALRFVAGAGMACIYPPGMKLAASWFQLRRGTALGILVGALAVGKAVPYLLASMTGDWRAQMLLLAAGSALSAVLIGLFAREGPYVAAAARLDPHAIREVVSQRETRLATFGYLGHMWELYAMWTWFGVFATASFAASGMSGAAAAGSLAGFIAIASGAGGSILAGHWADRYGRVRIAAASLAISGTCCIAAGFLFEAPAWAIYALAVVWGFTVVSDSAQFSALVTEHSPRAHVGTALTLQTCAGFLLTTISMRWLPELAAQYGWQWSFLLLVPGPVAGLLAMRRLKQPAAGSASS